LNLEPFLRGLVVGFSIAAPVGPIGVLCIRRTLAEGRAVGFASGLGAATADSLFGCVAALGLTVVSNILLGFRSWLSLGGGLFLCYLGVRTLLAQPANDGGSTARQGRGVPAAYGSTLLLTLANPMTIISYLGILAGVGSGGATPGYGAALTLVLGVFTGSAFWWLLLSSGVALLGKKTAPAALTWVNRIAGAVILGFGVLALTNLL
jgi:threonine/homoserine/homoserine lactone efflux protein